METNIWTMVSHGSGSDDVGDGLIKQMSKQLCISKKQFLELVKCTLSKEGYAELVTETAFGKRPS